MEKAAKIFSLTWRRKPCVNWYFMYRRCREHCSFTAVQKFLFVVFWITVLNVWYSLVMPGSLSMFLWVGLCIGDRRREDYVSVFFVVAWMETMSSLLLLCLICCFFCWAASPGFFWFFLCCSGKCVHYFVEVFFFGTAGAGLQIQAMLTLWGHHLKYLSK